MPKTKQDNLAHLLQAVNLGRQGAFDRLIEAVHPNLRRLASAQMRTQFGGRPLASLTRAPTEIAHDAIMLLRRQRTPWKNADHFFAISARVIFRCVQQYQRRRLTKKAAEGNRGSTLDSRLEPDKALTVPPKNDLAQDLLRQLHLRHPRVAEVVQLHIVDEHPLPKVARILDRSLRTVEREWALGRAWLRREMNR